MNNVERTVSSAVVTQPPRLTVGWLTCLALCLPLPTAAADLQPRTVQAYEKYADGATRDFVARARKEAGKRRCEGVMTGHAGGGDGIIDVPDGLIHHWVGTAFVKGATLRQVSDVARDYPGYSKVFKAVKSSKVLSHEGDVYRVLIRIEEGELGVNAVLEVRSTVDYRTLTDGSVSAVSRSEEIREVDNAGGPRESYRPVGRDNGYLWRAHTFSHFTADTDGVFIVMETLGLSRPFPRMTWWFLEPIARRMGRKSVEGSLGEFLTGIRSSAGLPAPKTSCS